MIEHFHILSFRLDAGTDIRMNESNKTHFDKSMLDESSINVEERIFAIVFAVFMVVDLLGNTLVCVVMRLRSVLDKTADVFVTSLSVSDIGVALTVMLLRMLEFLHIPLSRNACIWFITSDVLVSSASVLTLLGIAIDRYLMVYLPYLYPSVNTKRKAMYSVLILWLYSAFSAAFAPTSWTAFPTLAIIIQSNRCVINNKAFVVTSYSINIFIPLVIMSVIHFRLFLFSKFHQRGIRKLTISGIQNISSTSRTHKATITLIMVYGIFFICWFPNFFILMFFQIKPELVIAFHIQHPKVFKYIYNIFLVVLPPMNSTLNPLIYGIYHATFRRAVLKIFARQKRIRNARSLNSSTIKTRSGSDPGSKWSYYRRQTYELPTMV